MKSREEVKKFLDALGTLCGIYGVTSIKTGDNGDVRFSFDNSYVEAEYHKPYGECGKFFGVREVFYTSEYQPEEE